MNIMRLAISSLIAIGVFGAPSFSQTNQEEKDVIDDIGRGLTILERGLSIFGDQIPDNADMEADDTKDFAIIISGSIALDMMDDEATATSGETASADMENLSESDISSLFTERYQMMLPYWPTLKSVMDASEPLSAADLASQDMQLPTDSEAADLFSTAFIVAQVVSLLK